MSRDHADPLHHRDRLSAVQLFRPRRQSGRASTSISARMICEELKIACTVQMRRFDTLLRFARRQPRRRGDGLDRGHAGDRASSPISAIRITARRRASWRAATPRSTTCGPSSSKARRSRWSPAPRTRPISRRCSPRSDVRPYRHAGAGARGVAQGRGRSAVRRRHLARVLAQRHRLAELLRLPRRAVHRKPLLRRRRRHRGQARQRHAAAGASTGRCSGCGKRAASAICGCAISRSVRSDRNRARLTLVDAVLMKGPRRRT